MECGWAYNKVEEVEWMCRRGFPANVELLTTESDGATKKKKEEKKNT